MLDMSIALCYYKSCAVRDTAEQNILSERSNKNSERYRSGHNEAVLKTVWRQRHKGSNPFRSA